MRNEVIWAIRDARGLTAQEKSFLFVVESRGEMTTTATKAAEDMGLSRATYYRVRDSLLTKKCLTVRQRGENTSVYVVNEVSLSETQVSHSETPLSHSETKVSHCDNTKKNKEEVEEEREEESGPDGPVRESSPNVKEVNHLLLMSRGAREDLERAASLHSASPNQIQEAARLLTRSTVPGTTHFEKCLVALTKAGVEITEEW